MTDLKLCWHKLDNAAKIPTKLNEDAGYDIYTIENNVVIPAHEQYMFKTGLQVYIEGDYWLMGFDRGSTGSKGLHLHCGVVDKGYRGEIFVCIKNDNDYPALFTDMVDKPTKVEDENYGGVTLLYPITKAIAQLIPVKMPEVDSREVSDAEWGRLNFTHPTEREEGKLGSSGK